MNVLFVTDTYLDVSLAAKPGIGVNVLSFGEDAPNGIEGLFSGLFPRKMEEVDNRAIEFAKAEVSAADILRHLGARGGPTDWKLA